MPFYHYRQFDPGEPGTYDDARGLSVNLYVAADTVEQADEHARRIGAYFHEDDQDSVHRYWGDYDPVDPATVPAPGMPLVRDDNRNDNLGDLPPRKWLFPGQCETFVHPAEGDFYGAHAELEHIKRALTGYGVKFSRVNVGDVEEVGEDGFTIDGNRCYPAPGYRSWDGNDALVVNREDLRVDVREGQFHGEVCAVWGRDRAVVEAIATRAKAFVGSLPKLDLDGILGQ